MPTPQTAVLELDFDARPDPDEFVQAAMQWHFSPDTGSQFWVERVRSLGFDPLTDVRTFEDLAQFPNLTDELRDVRADALIPRGYRGRPDIVGIYESGGTTGAPKRIVFLRDVWERNLAWMIAHHEARGFPRHR